MPFDLLDELWSPIVAVTAAAGGRRTGLIASTAVTTSLAPEAPQVLVCLSRAALTRELVAESHAFALQRLPADALDVFRTLAFRSGRDRDKLAGLELRSGVTGAPLLAGALAYLEARVAAVLELAGATVFVGDVVAAERLRDGEPLTIELVRAQLTDVDLAAWERRRREELADGR